MDALRIPGGEHQSLGSPYTFYQTDASLGEKLPDIGIIVGAIGLIQEMGAGDMGFPPLYRHDAAHGSHVGGTHE